MIKALFNNSDLQAQFDKDGYVVMDFISEDDAKHIAKKFYEFYPNLPKGFYAAAFSSDDKLKQEIFDHTQSVFEKVVEKTFVDYKILGSTFLCKAPGEEGKVGVHQDWTVVDESKYASATIWVPTADTTEENGTLRVIPGSHKFFEAYRSNNIPFSYRGNEQLLWDNMQTVEMRAGQAFILNHAVLHASSANTTKQERLVIAYGIAPKEAKLMFYHKEPNVDNNIVEKYSMPDDFFQKYYNVGFRPLIGKLENEFEYTVKAASRNEIIELINKERKIRNLLPIHQDSNNIKQNPTLKSIIEKLKKWL